MSVKCVENVNSDANYRLFYIKMVSYMGVFDTKSVYTVLKSVSSMR